MSKLSKKEIDYLEKIGVMLSLIGITCVFGSIWSSGWTGLRLFITGLLLVVWGNGIIKKHEEDKS